jgi:hypothetical protein
MILEKRIQTFVWFALMQTFLKVWFALMQAKVYMIHKLKKTSFMDRKAVRYFADVGMVC